jgi:hypothetical protein
MTGASGAVLPNTGRMHTIRVAGTTLLTVAALALSGCGGSDTAGPQSGSSGVASVSGPGRCTTADLDVAMSPGEGAAGSTYYTVVLTNTSKSTCRTGGFGGVALVGGGDGRRIGAPADRVERATARPLMLKAGTRAQAKLQVTTAENYPTKRCRPAQAEGFRVYPPNETHSAFVRRATTACRNSAVHLLKLSPYQRAG